MVSKGNRTKKTVTRDGWVERGERLIPPGKRIDMTKVLNYSGDWYARVIAEDVCRLKEQLNLSLKEAFDYFMKKPVHDFDTLYKTLVMITHGVTFTIDTEALIQWCKNNPIKYKYCHQLWFRLKQELNAKQ